MLNFHSSEEEDRVDDHLADLRIGNAFVDDQRDRFRRFVEFGKGVVRGEEQTRMSNDVDVHSDGEAMPTDPFVSPTLRPFEQFPAEEKRGDQTAVENGYGQHLK